MPVAVRQYPQALTLRRSASNMTIYDPIAYALGITPNPKMYNEIMCEEVPNQYDPLISREEALKRNAEFIACDKCGIIGNRPNMMRWHFDKCKTVLKNCKQCGNIIPRQNVKDYMYNKKIYCNRDCYMASKKGIPPIIMTEEVKQKLRGPRKKKIGK